MQDQWASLHIFKKIRKMLGYGRIVFFYQRQILPIALALFEKIIKSLHQLGGGGRTGGGHPLFRRQRADDLDLAGPFGQGNEGITGIQQAHFRFALD